ncbi:hypothetical protein BDN72DRAFT_839886 [Pluteus cervinus]|uniref:Uncharacterized protein n=1 Tax=Pluteus cervinus TaxID=181527 RepID=A0ACD3AVR0_9AGAR|nr:hypothetical protein BDN72DRAFT_839886 [Pluteus cervinus]
MLSRRLLPQLSNSLKTFARSASSFTSSTVPATKAATSIQPSVVTQQAPNQRQRPVAGESPRFEQTHMELQPAPLSAMELIANEPVRFVEDRKAICDGAGGPLSHPKIYINLEKPGPHPCGYCGLQFEQAPHHPTYLHTVQTHDDRRKTDLYIVRLKPGASQNFGLRQVERTFEHFRSFSAYLSQDELNRLRASPDVEYIVKDAILRIPDPM